jgi:hypothetical protein
MRRAQRANDGMKIYLRFSRIVENEFFRTPTARKVFSGASENFLVYFFVIFICQGSVPRRRGSDRTQNGLENRGLGAALRFCAGGGILCFRGARGGCRAARYCQTPAGCASGYSR